MSQQNKDKAELGQPAEPALKKQKTSEQSHQIPVVTAKVNTCEPEEEKKNDQNQDDQQSNDLTDEELDESEGESDDKEPQGEFNIEEYLKWRAKNLDENEKIQMEKVKHGGPQEKISSAFDDDDDDEKSDSQEDFVPEKEKLPEKNPKEDENSDGYGKEEA